MRLNSSIWSAARAHSSRARQTASSLGLALSQRVSRSPASFEPTGTGCQGGHGEPDAIVVGSHRLGLLKRPAHPFEWVRLVVEGPEQAQSFGGIP